MIAIKGQEMIEVYSNDDGEVVIQQQHRQDDPHSIYVWPEHVDTLIEALRKAKDEVLR